VEDVANHQSPPINVGQRIKEQITDVVVTVPAYFGESERAATRLAGEMAELTVHLLPAEPMAAAVAHGLEEKTSASTVLVFDILFPVIDLRQATQWAPAGTSGLVTMWVLIIAGWALSLALVAIISGLYAKKE
jgi:hypothetical protein